MFSHIVCGIDFSDSSRTALRHADQMATRFASRLSVVAVNELLLAQAAAIAYDVNYLQSETEKELQTFVAQTITSPVDVGDAIVTTGPAAESILTIAAERHADLIVLGTHGLSGFKKLFFGSVTEAVLRRTHIPVLVIPTLEPAAGDSPLTDGGVVLAPVDFSEH